MLSPEKQKILRDILCCPKCFKDLNFLPDRCECSFCRAQFPFLEGAYCFRENISALDDSKDGLNRFKGFFKRYSSFYVFAVKVFSPVLFPLHPTKGFKIPGRVILEIGSGNAPAFKESIACDAHPYPNVDVVCDAAALPFKSNSVDGVISIAVLEHVPNSQKAVDEMHRTLKEEGRVFNVIPFMQPFHASPGDYQRFTVLGIRNLHHVFQEISCGIYSGPCSGILWIEQEFLSTVFSFGFPPLKIALFLILMVLTFPLKYLDLIFNHVKFAENMASSFYFYGIKRDL